MDYKVVVTSDAEEDLDRFLQYLLFEKKNEQAAGNILDDFGDTLNCLKALSLIHGHKRESNAKKKRVCLTWNADLSAPS